MLEYLSEYLTLNHGDWYGCHCDLFLYLAHSIGINRLFSRMYKIQQNKYNKITKDFLLYLLFCL